MIDGPAGRNSPVLATRIDRDGYAESSGRASGKAILVMQAAEDRVGDEIGIRGHDMPFREYLRRIRLTRFRHSWPEADVRAGAVVMRGPFADDAAEMLLAERDDPVETLAAHRADQALTECVRLRRVRRSAERGDAETMSGATEVRVELARAVVDQMTDRRPHHAESRSPG